MSRKGFNLPPLRVGRVHCYILGCFFLKKLNCQRGNVNTFRIASLGKVMGVDSQLVTTSGFFIRCSYIKHNGPVEPSGTCEVTWVHLQGVSLSEVLNYCFPLYEKMLLFQNLNYTYVVLP